MGRSFVGKDLHELEMTLENSLAHNFKMASNLTENLSFIRFRPRVGQVGTMILVKAGF